MGYTLEQLSSTCRDILTADRGPEGRKQVCAVIRDVLLDTAFTKMYLVDGGPERNILYEDPELARGANVWGGRIVHPAVAAALGEPAAALEAVLGG